MKPTIRWLVAIVAAGDVDRARVIVEQWARARASTKWQQAWRC